MAKTDKLKFREKLRCDFWREKASEDNPYLSKEIRLHGFELFELVEQKSFVEVLYLLFVGELPTQSQKNLLEKLMIVQMNPGPRHPACRAAMTAAISKTRPVHLLPIGLITLGGEHLGAGEVEAAMQYLSDHEAEDPAEIADTLLANSKKTNEGDWHIAPGFGSRFGGVDPKPNQFVERFGSNEHFKYLTWGARFVSKLRHHNIGWLDPGLAAAVFLDLGLKSREGAGLFQYLAAPGILAHGMEQSHRPVTDLPFVKDENYVIEEGIHVDEH